MTPRKLKAWRQRLDLSQDGLARWLGVSRSTVNRWEGGLAPIPQMVALVENCYRKDDDQEIDEGIGHARLTGQENYDHENQHQPPLENPMDWEK
jgi:DNA-binding XRE family transcriptional regulator